MATTATFGNMLNEYLTYDLLREELIKRDYLMKTVNKDNSWKGGTMPVPFKGAGASSVKFGGLTASNDIGEDLYVRGNVTDYKEVHGSLIFNHKDLIQHDGRMPEDTFLRVMEDTLPDFMNYFKMVASIALTTGPHFAVAVGDGGVDGTIQVNKVDRFMIGQKVVLDDGNSAPGTYYVINIDVNNGVVGSLGSGDITLSATRGGAAADVSAFTTAQAAVFYHDGVDATGTTTFTSLKSQLLPLAQGGSANLFGVSKLAYPYLQAVAISGAAISATNILEHIFDAYTQIRSKAKGNAKEVLMGYKHFGSIMKIIEAQKGAFKVKPDSESASEYGWTTIEIGSVTGTYLKLVAIQEMDDDVMMFMDWSAVKLHSNGLVRKHKSPDGNEYFVVRNTTGYQYICDIEMYGELVVSKPGHCGIIHSIPNY
jgi:hypothetical protein